MDRKGLLRELGQRRKYDVAIVGGGATGLGVALDAAARGLRMVLLESHDFAKGTSSRATKLVHGGVRYLAQGNIALVREALHERTTLLKNAPHLAQPLPFVMLSYRAWETPFYGLRRQDAEATGRAVHPIVAPSQGVHAVVDRDFLPGQHALMVPRTADGRVLFGVPWMGKLILGTTDTPRGDLPREPRPFREEL